LSKKFTARKQQNVSADHLSAAVQPIKVLLIEPKEGQPSYLRHLLDERYAVIHEPNPLRAWEMILMGFEADAALLSTDAEFVLTKQLLTWIRDGRLRKHLPLWTYTLGPEQKVSQVAALANPEHHLSGPQLLTALHSALASSLIASVTDESDYSLADHVPMQQVNGVALNGVQSEQSAAVLLWLINQQAQLTGKMLFVGQVTWHVDNHDGRLRPDRYGLMRQMLRSGDHMMCEDDGRFWLILDIQDELRATKVALRMAVALTRSTDPGSFPVAMGLSGCYVNGSAQLAARLCVDNLAAKPPGGQIEVSVDRWRFALPIRIAQALVTIG
jgi:hypothetical protein